MFMAVILITKVRSAQVHNSDATGGYDASVDYWIPGMKEVGSAHLPHRVNGPAVIQSDGYKEWWLYGKPIPKDIEDLPWSL